MSLENPKKRLTCPAGLATLLGAMVVAPAHTSDVEVANNGLLQVRLQHQQVRQQIDAAWVRLVNEMQSTQIEQLERQAAEEAGAEEHSEAV